LYFTLHEQANERIVELVHCTIRVVRHEEMAAHLARDAHQHSKKLVTFEDTHDPMVHVQLLRSHLYSPQYLQLLERMKLLDHLNLFVAGYREVLKLASTPLPFTMIQMGRTFLFLWTFSLPFALVGAIGEFVSGILSVLLFVFFLTYGFIGLEFVSMQLLHPFGDGVNDIGIEGMGRAIVRGIDKDTDNLQVVQDSLPPRSSPRNATGTATSTRHLEMDKNQQYSSEAAPTLSKDSTDYTFHTSYHTCPA
jgi:predicted membrane chloride channel (bestrophin family)